MPLSPALVAEIQSKFPERFLSTDTGDLEAYGKDWTRVYSAAPSAVVFPESTHEVSEFLKLCSKHRVDVVPSGGRTGLAGGAVAARGEVVLSLERMRKMGPVDTLARTVRVQAGAVTEAVHQHCEPYGLTWPVDFASKGSSQVGGNISTNAGGVRVIRYGLTRQWVLGLQVVTSSGEILELNGALEKNNTGMDLRQAFIGSEGTLGIITEATLKLTDLPGESDVFFFGVDGVPAVLKLFHEVRKKRFVVNAFEFLGQNCLDSVTALRGLTSPLQAQCPYYVLIEIERSASPDFQAELEKWLESLFEVGLVQDGTLAQSPQEARNLWVLREGISESLSARGMVHKHDIALPIAELEGFTQAFLSSFQSTYRGYAVFLFGHIGDGNLHVNIMKPADQEKGAFVAECKKIDEDLFQLVQKHHGSVSAEHGIGLLKKSALHFSRSPEEIRILKALKQALDPQGILNPGKILD